MKKNFSRITWFIEVLKKRKIIIKYSAIFFIVGVIIALTTPNKYKVSTIMVPQSNNSSNIGMEGLSSLAAFAGIDINTTNPGTISPLVYPKILQSVPFVKELMYTKYFNKNANKEITLLEYYTDYKKSSLIGIIIKYTIGLPSLIFKGGGDSTKNTFEGIIKFNKDEDDVLKSIQDDIELELNAKFGTVVINVTYDDPYFTALVAKKVQKLLQEYITTFKIQSATEQLKFVQKRYEEKKVEFEEVQNKLALYRDRNRNIISQISKADEDRLISEYNLAFSVYTELAKQLEKAQISIKEDTPVFTIIDPIKVPIKKSAPSRILIILLWGIIGANIGLALVFYQKKQNDKIEI